MSTFNPNDTLVSGPMFGFRDEPVQPDQFGIVRDTGLYDSLGSEFIAGNAPDPFLAPSQQLQADIQFGLNNARLPYQEQAGFAPAVAEMPDPAFLAEEERRRGIESIYGTTDIPTPTRLPAEYEMFGVTPDFDRAEREIAAQREQEQAEAARQQAKQELDQLRQRFAGDESLAPRIERMDALLDTPPEQLTPDQIAAWKQDYQSFTFGNPQLLPSLSQIDAMLPSPEVAPETYRDSPDLRPEWIQQAEQATPGQRETIRGMGPVLGPAAAGLAQVGGSIASLASRPFSNDAADYFQARSQSFSDAVQETAAEGSVVPEKVQLGIQGAVRSIVQMGATGAAGRAGTALTPIRAMIAGAAVETYNSSLSEATAAGVTGKDRQEYAAKQAVVEAATTAAFQRVGQMIPGFGGAEDALSKPLAAGFKAGMKDSLKRLPVAVVAENAEELTIAAAGELLRATELGQMERLSPENLQQIGYQTAITTTLTMGLAEGGRVVASSLRSPQEAAQFVEQHPEAAERLAASQGSRKDFADATGMDRQDVTISSKDRQVAVENVKAALDAQRQQATEQLGQIDAEVKSKAEQFIDARPRIARGFRNRQSPVSAKEYELYMGEAEPYEGFRQFWQDAVVTTLKADPKRAKIPPSPEYKTPPPVGKKTRRNLERDVLAAEKMGQLPDAPFDPNEQTTPMPPDMQAPAEAVPPPQGPVYPPLAEGAEIRQGDFVTVDGQPFRVEWAVDENRYQLSGPSREILDVTRDEIEGHRPIGERATPAPPAAPQTPAPTRQPKPPTATVDTNAPTVIGMDAPTPPVVENVPEPTAIRQPPVETPPQAEPPRELPIAREDVQKVFRGAEVEDLTDAPGWRVRFKNGNAIDVRVEDKIEVPDRAKLETRLGKKLSENQWLKLQEFGAKGAFRLHSPSKQLELSTIGLIRLSSKRSADWKTLRHEAVHFAKQAGMFNEKEWGTLVRKYSSPDRDVGQQEEDIATASRAWGEGTVLASKVRKFARETLKGVGVKPDAATVEALLETEEFWSRPAASRNESRQVAAETVEQPQPVADAGKQAGAEAPAAASETPAELDTVLKARVDMKQLWQTMGDVMDRGATKSYESWRDHYGHKWVQDKFGEDVLRQAWDTVRSQQNKTTREATTPATDNPPPPTADADVHVPWPQNLSVKDLREAAEMYAPMGTKAGAAQLEKLNAELRRRGLKAVKPVAKKTEEPQSKIAAVEATQDEQRKQVTREEPKAETPQEPEAEPTFALKQESTKGRKPIENITGEQETMFPGERPQENLPGQREMFDEFTSEVKAPSKARQAIEYVAQQRFLDANELSEAVEELYQFKKAEIGEFNNTLGQWLRNRGLNKQSMERAGDAANWPGFDEIADEFITNNPGFAKDSQELWDLLLQGKKELPRKHDFKFVNEAADYLERAIAADVPVEEASMFFKGTPEIKTTATKTGEPESAAAIMARLQKDLMVPIRSGRMPKARAAGAYKVQAEVIRTKPKFYGDLAVVSHEVAHHLDKKHELSSRLTNAERAELQKLDYEPEKKRAFEGFAEYVRHYLTDDDAATVAREFHKKFTAWLKQNEHIGERIGRAKRLIDNWRAATPMERGQTQISDTGKPARPAEETKAEFVKELISTGAERAYVEWKDPGYALKKLDDMAKERGYSFRYAETPAGQLYEAFTKAHVQAAHRALENGVHTVGERYQILGPSLPEALSEINPGKDYEEFRTFAHARHAVETYAKRPDYNPGMRKEDAEAIVAKIEADPDKNSRYETAAQQLTDYNNSLLDLLVDASYLTADEAKAMKDAHETYLPLMRAKKSRGFFGRRQGDEPSLARGIKGRSKGGSGEQILDPIESTILRTIRFYELAMQHQVHLQIVREADPALGGAEGMGEIVEHVDPNQRSTSAEIDGILDSLVKEGVVEADFAKQMRAVNRLRGGALSKRDGEFLSNLAGIDISDMEATEARDALLDQFEDVPDLRAMVTIWKPDFSPAPGERVMRIIVNGKPRLYKMHDDLYDALRYMNPQQFHPFVNVFGAFTRMVKTGAVGLSTAFGGKNVVRDYQQFQNRSKFSRGLDSTYSPFVWMARYIRSELGKNGIYFGKEDQTVQLFQEFSGEINTRLGTDPKGMREMREAIVNKGKTVPLREMILDPARLRHTVKAPVRGLRWGVMVTEVGPRLAEFSGVLKNHGFVRDPETGLIVSEETGKPARPPRSVLVQAINEAGDVTLNYKRRGPKAEVVDQFIPFFNAWMEGIDKDVRTIRDARTNKNLAARYLISSMLAASATALYWASRHDDDDYKEEEPWLKYGYWTFADGDGNPYLRIPKPHGILMGIINATEGILGSMSDDAQSGFAEAMKETGKSMMPGTDVPLATTAIEVGFNYDTFRETAIEGPALQNRRPEDRFTPYTSELAKAIGQWTGPWGLSPAKLEHAVNKLSGGAYGRITRTAENVAEGDLEFRDVPFAGGYAIPHDYPRSVGEFYDEKERIEQDKGSAEAHGEDKPELAERVKELDWYADMMAAIRKARPLEVDSEEWFEHERFIIGLAREALGREPLDRYPNPFTADDMPAGVRAAVDKEIGKRLNAASMTDPERHDHRAKTDAEFDALMAQRKASREAAAAFLSKAGVTGDDAIERFRKAWNTERGQKPDFKPPKFNRNRSQTAYGKREAQLKKLLGK